MALEEDLLNAAKFIREHPLSPICTHIVSPKALDSPGIYQCANCGAPVKIPYPLREHIYPSEQY